MALFDVIGELYDPNADVKPRFLVNQGGTSSGKTYTIMQRLIVLSFEHPMAIITVCGQDLPNLKVGAMRDLDTILHTRAELLDWFKNNKSDSSYRGKNGYSGFSLSSSTSKLRFSIASSPSISATACASSLRYTMMMRCSSSSAGS
jgi:hypothetical protein